MNQIPLLAGMNEEDVQRLLINHFLNANYKNLSPQNKVQPDLVFKSNHEFWQKIIHWDRVPMKFVTLEKFQITDWFPRTPGIYHTTDAEWARQEAKKYLVELKNISIYEPRGKMHMIDGGLGSIRFKPVQLNNEDFWLCTATSDSYCHTGVPIAISNHLMNSIEVNSTNFYELTGEIRYIPNSLDNYYQHVRNIPQIYIQIEKIQKLKEKGNQIVVSPLVFFQSSFIENIKYTKQDFVTYVTIPVANFDFKFANEWLENYTEQYKGKIVTNYDECSPYFKEAPFSLQNVMNGNIYVKDLERFNIYQAKIVCESINNINSNQIDMSKIEITLGNGNTFQGDFVVAKKIENSFNKLDSSNVNNELKTLLKELASAIGSIQNSLDKQDALNISRDLETLSTEITSEAPRKNWINMSLESIKNVAVKVGEIGLPIINLITSILPLFQ